MLFCCLLIGLSMEVGKEGRCVIEIVVVVFVLCCLIALVRDARLKGCWYQVVWCAVGALIGLVLSLYLWKGWFHH